MEMSHTYLFKRRSFQVLLSFLGLSVIVFALLAAAPFTSGLGLSQGGLDPSSHGAMLRYVDCRSRR
jgi:hypothetical protein